MTIAIAVKANDGVVIAADTQEGSGFVGGLKSDQSKIRAYENTDGEFGVCAISGAGWGDYIDALSDKLGQVFLDHGRDSIDDLQGRFERCLVRFHRQHILPYAAYPDHDRPAVQMLIAIQSRKIVNPQILVTRNSAIHRCALRHGRRWRAVRESHPWEIPDARPGVEDCRVLGLRDLGG